MSRLYSEDFCGVLQPTFSQRLARDTRVRACCTWRLFPCRLMGLHSVSYRTNRQREGRVEVWCVCVNAPPLLPSSEKSGRCCCCCCCERAAAPESHSLSHPPPLQQRTQDALRVWDASCTCLLHALLSFCEELLEWGGRWEEALAAQPNMRFFVFFFFFACV